MHTYMPIKNKMGVQCHIYEDIISKDDYLIGPDRDEMLARNQSGVVDQLSVFFFLKYCWYI